MNVDTYPKNKRNFKNFRNVCVCDLKEKKRIFHVNIPY